jgi:hypothetical protein
MWPKYPNTEARTLRSVHITASPRGVMGWPRMACGLSGTSQAVASPPEAASS